MATASELTINTSATALDMAQAMFGNGITVLGASYTGATSASGIYSNGDSITPTLTPADSGVILSTGRATSVTSDFGLDNLLGLTNVSHDTSTNFYRAGDADLDAISGQSTFDAAVLEAEFVPDGSVLTMQVVFSSEEYLEYVGDGFNDAVGIWVNGAQAELKVGTGDITVNNINSTTNENLYINNPVETNAYNTEMDGFTVTLSLKALVIPDQANTIKIAIADAGDGILDSNLLIAGNSVQTAIVAGDDTVEGVAGDTIFADLLANDQSTIGGTLTIVEINGQPVGIGDTVGLSTGESILLTDTGMILATATQNVGSNSLSYTVQDAAGNTDVAFVTLITTAPCFTAGTLIDTPNGKVAIDALKPGDEVLTCDNGAQRVRWVGQTERRAAGDDAPVVFDRNACGRHDALELSPNHRVLVSSPLAELYFASHQVLVKAKDLVNGRTIRRRTDGAPVHYVHLLFDRHEIIRGNGLPSESYHPGEQTLQSFDTETEAELQRLFPELFETGPETYGQTARYTLRSFEARALLGAIPLESIAVHP
ncbi:MAG: choice-of-anchor L domain-containing protein [Roseovarius sp.]|jgi:hypothetical protein|uniref:choice-of-anchor L domain-containing protein n=1 Tax=Roseovarius sp. TaxID=1486281 RepID=UPI0032EFFCB7